TLALSATTSRAPGDLSVTFLGRRLPDASPDYKIALLPDTQYYTNSHHGGAPEMLASQMKWLAQNAKKLGVAFALHLGDITDTGDAAEDEWKVASEQGLYLLEDPALTGLPEGLPYSPAVGNHDQRHQAAPGKIAWDGPGALYEKYFGVAHFKNKSYYGGHLGKTNHNHYMLFDAGTDKYIVISLQFGFPKKNPDALAWASALLDRHPDRRAILVTHGALLPGLQGNFLPDGQAAYDALKKHPNLMLIVGGHVTGEGHRADTFEDRVVHSILMDFQHDDTAGVENGGNGFLGILTLSPRRNTIRVQTYSPYTNTWRTDPAADYTLDHDFGAKIEPFQKLATTTAAAGATATFRWENLKPDAACEWRAEISDGKKSTLTEPQLFQTSR
ncbi:MAG: metallophosphoesterase, partial [Opitutaceae bacterium]|nr:metallophosphoesterase [Opitutaceae bacterium]